MSKKILLLVDSLGSGGAQNQITLLAAGLKEKNHDVTVFTYYEHDFFKKRLLAAGVRHIQEIKTGKLGMNVIRHLLTLLNREKFDVAISYLDTPNFYLCLASKFAKSKPKIMVSYRSKSDFSQMTVLKKYRQTWINRTADIIITNSIHERERWQKKYPDQAHKWRTIYNMVDLDKFTYNEKNTTERASALIAVGKVRPLKNAGILIEALHYLKKQNRPIPEIHWYGSRKFKQPEFQANVKEIEEKIEKYDLSDHIKWFEPVKNLEELMPRYLAMIHPSLWEGLPNVICEALASGLPVLASNILDHPVLIENYKRGFLFDPKNSVELAEAIASLQNMSKESHKKMALNCRNYAEKSFDKTTRLQAYESLF